MLIELFHGDSRISGISRGMLEEADRSGKVWRFIGRAGLANHYLSAKPELVDKDSPLGKTGWRDKAICMQTRSQGTQICCGIGAADTAIRRLLNRNRCLSAVVRLPDNGGHLVPVGLHVRHQFELGAGPV